MNRSSLGLAALCLVACLIPSAFAQGDGLSSKEFKRALASPDSHFRHREFLKLNGDDKKQLKLLFDLLEGGSWYDREAAVICLARAANSDSIAEMVKKLGKDKNYLVRQGIVVAFAKMNDSELYQYIFEALDDKDPRVRREAAYALRINRKKDSITALINRWLEEEDPVVSNFIRMTLEDITRRYHGPDPLLWNDWWVSEQDSFVVGSTDEEAERLAEESGNKMREGQTITRDLTLNTESRGHGAPLLVIPPYGYSKDIIVPFLTELEKTNKIYYIDLPPIDSFSGLEQIGGMNYYPIDKLVDAFEQLRKDTEEERFALMCWGMNSWIALRYASKYPGVVSHLVLVSPLSGNDEYGEASARMIKQGKQTGDMEMWHYGLTRSFNIASGLSSLEMHYQQDTCNNECKCNFSTSWQEDPPDGEGGGMDRRSWSMMFANPQDSLLALLYPIKDRQLGGVAIPDFPSKEDNQNLPRGVRMLFINGKYSLYSSSNDVSKMSKKYGAIFLEYKASSNMPQAEESERFNEDLKDFLGKGR